MKKIFFSLLVIIMLSACDQKTEPVTQEIYHQEEVISDHQVEETDAIEGSEAEVSEGIESISYEPQPVPQVIRDEVHIAYQIFPIAFADADGNGLGDIKGITDQLDYLKDDLKVDIIWLNPVHPSPSYHKYDVTDYHDIDLSFGTLEDYKTLLSEAHKRDIRVLLDFVINHTSSKHPWFINAKSSEDSEYRAYYVWNTLEEDAFNSKNGWYSVSGSDEKYFASFWNEMPELNFENPAVREEIKNIATFWLDLGVDGFRIDAAKHVYDINEYPKGTPVMEKNYSWFLEFNAHIKTIKPDAFLILETWDSYNTISRFLPGTDSAFNFDLGESIISSVVSGNRKTVQDKLTKIHTTYDKVTQEYVDSVFLANHDQNRLMSQLGNDLNKGKLAATIEFTLPGLSWIYYGDELGMLGAKPDENIREAFKWTMDRNEAPNSKWRLWNYNSDVQSLDLQREDPASMFNTYKSLTTLKASDEVIRLGDYVDYEIGTSFRIFAFYRTYQNKTYLVLHNLYETPQLFTAMNNEMTLIYSTMDSRIEGDQITLEPYGSLVIEVKDSNFSVEAPQ